MDIAEGVEVWRGQYESRCLKGDVEIACTSSLLDQGCSRDPEHNEEPREHDAAGRNQAAMDARPSAADAISPECGGGPYSNNCAEDAEPREGIEHQQQRIESVIENGDVYGSHGEKHRNRSDDGRVGQQDEPYDEIFAQSSAVLAPSLLPHMTP